jgi:FtsP/CotA-like multicopper oxidase with cupredoxin domain
MKKDYVSATKAGVLLAAISIAAVIAISLVTPPAAAHLANPPFAEPTPFANPPEIRSRAAEKRLRAVLEIIDGKYSIPNMPGPATPLRQYRGWDAAEARPTPPPPGTPAGPGPTLRVRLGDQVQIAFLNRVDELNFAYSQINNDLPGLSDRGCDKVFDSTADPPTFWYPRKDRFPNCFHGSVIANVHFHGTHTSPDGLGDNVLVQVVPDPKQPDWTAAFDTFFNSRTIPQKWSDMPEAYRKDQIRLIKEYDEKAKAMAIKNRNPVPDPMAPKNAERIAAGLWPQFFYGAFPNFFEVPDYTAKKPDGSRRWNAGQAPGTHWYHSHKHGSTSLHIRNGLAGALIIESNQEGGYDHVIRKFYGWGDTYGETHEKIFVFQQYDPTHNLERKKADGLGSRQTLVNGEYKPVITMKPGEVQLWRFINATEGNLSGGVIDGGVVTDTRALFEANGFLFKQTAQDGVQFSRTNYKNQPFLTDKMVPDGFKLAAGNRADLLVQAPKTPGLIEFKSGGTTIFSVNVTGSPETRDKPFPDEAEWTELPAFLNDLVAPDPYYNNNTLRFQWERGRPGPGRIDGQPPHFMINDKQFEEKGEVVDQCMPLNGVEDWVLENWTTAVAHPFHIHINPFQVIKIEKPFENDDGTVGIQRYQPKDNFVWQDVIAIPAAVIHDGTVTPGRVTIRHKFLDFPGTFVLHCHILAHEDRGMMQLVRIVPEDKYPHGCQDRIPAHH